ncbi:MAG TPA: class I SAM-dependent methyltransferase [Solirubrobacteraceae bacterium]|nr:class I SAM-dependent methyltransferase [Solirubrobacteraceae bacterium]
MSASIPTGNTFDKYGSTNPVVRRLMSGFEAALDALFLQAAPRSLLDIGCGEGILTEQWATRLGEGRVMGVDLPDPKLAAHWQARTRPNLEFGELDVTRGLPYADREFDLVCATEVLEHVPGPGEVVAEMARVAARHLIVSVPHEPLWRMLNVARGAYLRDLGNTPGHINHWTRRGFVRLLSNHGTVTEIRSPFPWTMLLVRVGQS